MKTSRYIFIFSFVTIFYGVFPALAGENDVKPFEAWKDSGGEAGEYWVPPENETVTYPKYDRWGVITSNSDDSQDEENTLTQKVAPAAPDPSYCPLWHNRPKALAWAKYHRKRHFMGLKRYPEEVMVLHRHDHWKAPRRIGGKIHLKRIETDGETPYAILSIGKGMLCEANDIKVEVDDQPTPGTVILAIEPDFVLIEHQSELGVWLAEGASMPSWRMIWDTGVEVELEDELVTGSKTSRKKKKKSVKGKKKAAKTRAKKK